MNDTYQGLTAQMEYMKTLTNAFDYTDNEFANGNMMYYTVKGNRHLILEKSQHKNLLQIQKEVLLL